MCHLLLQLRSITLWLLRRERISFTIRRCLLWWRYSLLALIVGGILFLSFGLVHTPLGRQQSVLAQVGPVWNHSSVQDFDSGCTGQTNVRVTNMSGGEIRLAAALEDYFDGPTLDSSRWVSGVVNNGYVVEPVYDEGLLLLDGRWISSTLSLDSFPAVVEGRMRFAEPGGGTGWADVGLAKASQIPGPPNALFITDDNGNLSANDYQPGAASYQRTVIGGFEWDEFHDFRFVVDPNQIDYFIDDQLVVTHPLTTPLTTPLYLWAYTQVEDVELALDWLRLAVYPGSGQFSSCPIDTGGQTEWDHLAWQGEAQPGTAVDFNTRTSVDGLTWSAWTGLGVNGAILSPPGRYLQYRIDLSTLDPTVSPEVDQVVVVPASFVRDTSVVNFSDCSTLDNTSVTNLAGGEIRLAALVEDYFEADSLDTSKWVTGHENAGYIVPPRLEDGLVIVDGGWISATTAISSAHLPVVVEGRARFAEPGRGTGWGDIGLAKITQIPGPPNTLFISDNDGHVYANDYQPGAGGPQRTIINGFDWTQFHDFRFVLDTNHADYYVDGQLQVSHPLSTPMIMPMYLWIYSQFQDYDLAVDWLRAAHYPATGQFTSCPIDMESNVTWTDLSGERETPTGTAIDFETRSSVDGVAWSTWEATGAGGEINSPAGRYLQYRATLTTTDPTHSPQIEEVNIGVAGVLSLNINNLQAIPTSPTTALITWQTDALANSHLDYGLTNGLGTVVSKAEYVTEHAFALTSLQPKTKYYFRVTSQRTSGQIAESEILSFTTPSNLISQISAADFGQGAACNELTHVIVSDVTGGEVRLRSTILEDYFNGTSLDTTQWAGRTLDPSGPYSPVIGGGTVQILNETAGARLRTIDQLDLSYRRVVEFRAKFGDSTYQHAGFSNFNEQWAIFSTGTDSMTGADIFAWSTNNGDPASQVTALPDLELDTFYDFRVVWDTHQVEFWVEDVLRATHTITIPGPLWAHTTNVKGNWVPMYLDYFRLADFPSGGSFRSCPVDAGQTVTWGTLNWEVQTPVGTGLSFRTRSSLDGSSWSDWSSPITTPYGPITSPAGRYFEYEASLSSNNSEFSPVLEAVHLDFFYPDPPTPTATATSTPTPTNTPTGGTTAVTTATPTTTAVPVPIPSASPTTPSSTKVFLPVVIK